MGNNSFESAFEIVQKLAREFDDSKKFFLSSEYQEAEVRKDFIDKFFIALGWDVNHVKQTNPYEQEVKVERGVATGGSQRRADFAFCLAPNFRDIRFFVEAKKPFVDIGTKDFFQLIRYGWNSQTPLAALTSFEQFHIIDCRYKPDIETALNRSIAKYYCTDYSNREKFLEIYWLFSREAVVSGSLEKRAKELPKLRGKALQRGLFAGGYQSIDESFLAELDEYRTALAHTFKNRNPKLDSEALTELAQRTLDRLVFLRFLEDKGIEAQHLVERFGEKGTVWEDFIMASRRLDGIYNGIVYKHHDILDGAKFRVDEDTFADICERLAHINSPYDFNAIPIHILGSIYERFLGKVIIATDKRVRIEEKPEVRKAGGVYYTPEYIVRYIVENTVGKLIAGKTPNQIAEMRFADIACGSGSFLLGVFDLLLNYHGHYYNNNPGKARKGDCIKRDGKLFLTLGKKREILLNNIYGVDIDAQAVEVCQLSLYLKLLQEETEASAQQYLLDFEHIAQMKKLLPDLSKNIVCGNSLIGMDILEGQLFAREEERRLNPMNFEHAFPEVMKRGGFDAIVGNPPYHYSAGQNQKDYFKSHFKLTEYQTDLYIYFIERAIHILKNNGCMGMIVSDSWIKGKYFTKLRGHLLQQTQLESVTVFDYPPFRGATIENSIVMLNKAQPKEAIVVRTFTSPTELTDLNVLTVKDCLVRGFIDIYQCDAHLRVIEEFERNSIPLSNFCKINRGVHAYRTDGYGESKFLKGPQTKRDKDEQSYHSTKKIDSSYFPEIKGKHLGRYSYTWDGIYISYGNWLAEPRTPEFFFNPKLAIRKIVAQKLVCTFIKESIILDQSVYVAIREKKDPPSLLFLLGILTSAIGGWYIQTKYGIYDTLYPWFTKEQLSQFPIPNLDFSKPADKLRHDEIVAKVEAMLEAKKQLAQAQTDKDKTYYKNKCAALDRRIDQLVYGLYGLSEDEIKVVEERA